MKLDVASPADLRSSWRVLQPKIRQVERLDNLSRFAGVPYIIVTGDFRVTF